MGLKSGERKADKIGSEEKASKGEEAEECGVGVEELGVAAEEEMAEVLKVEERWSGDLVMAGEAMGWCDPPLGLLFWVFVSYFWIRIQILGV